MGTGKHRWKFSFHRSSSQTHKKSPPPEFICPIAGTLMADPVIVPSGETFERNCILACKELGYSPHLPDGSRPDLSNIIPNSTFKSTIFNWCDAAGADHPKPLQFEKAKELVRGLVASESKGVIQNSEEVLLRGVSENPRVKFSHAATEVKIRPRSLYFSSSEESDAAAAPPLPLKTKPSCYNSSSSSSEISSIDETLTLGSNSEQEEEIFNKLKSPQIMDQEEGVISLRKISKSSLEQRVPLCSPRVLTALRPLLVSKYTQIQINSVAAIVNLSLEKDNKVQIVRSGVVPALIDVLKGGSLESQDHAAGAIFSLALSDENKTAIGVLGAIPPLLHLLMRSESSRAREDSALALYHLSLVQANRTKLVRLGAVPALLGMARGGELASRALIVLCSIAASAEGRAALLDAHAVERLVATIRGEGGQPPEGTVTENCVAVLYALSQSGMRFIGSAKAVEAAEVLKEAAEKGSERTREKAKRMLMMLKERREDREEGFSLISDDDDGAAGGENYSRTSDSTVAFHRRYGNGKNASGANSTEF